MKKVLIFAGTTEGRELAKVLSKAFVSCVVCVATEYGEQVMEESEYIHVHMGRMDVPEMIEFIKGDSYVAVVDATHPFATLVTEHIKEAVKQVRGISYFRLGRDVSLADNQFVSFASTKDCARALKEVSGNILLTTGSKELSVFCEEKELLDRLIVRVLPGMESIKLCYDFGFLGKQIIAMQGPFSKEMNLAMIKQYNIACLVTKESGKTGGVDTKLLAAKEADIPVYMIKKPVDEKEKQYDLFKIFKELSALLDIPAIGEKTDSCDFLSYPDKGEGVRIDVVLAGIGMGHIDTMTMGLKNRLKETDYLFGAKRMLGDFNGKKGTYPYYLAKDIIPVLSKISKEECGEVKVTILYSGDSGFYSGCEKMRDALLEVVGVSVSILPGISSISYMASKVGVSWQDAAILSTHGVEKKQWVNDLYESVKHKKKTFFITSGVKDIHLMGKLLNTYEKKDDLTCFIGYQLSYPEESVAAYSFEACESLEKDGLYVGLILNEKVQSHVVTPGRKDEEFFRDKVPMTKEEVRHASICKLGLLEDSVVYDIGSGTGSIAIEMALLSEKIKVYAIEQNEVAVNLIEENIQKFDVKNIEVIHALAPEGLSELEKPDAAFIGGSKGNLFQIIEALLQKNPKIKVVINAVSLETLKEILAIKESFLVTDFSLLQMAVNHTKEVGSYTMMQGENPVYICSVQFGDKKE